jgi:hypothetical protein
MTKREAESIIRRLVHDWARERGIEAQAAEQPSFSDFKSWLSDKGYSHLLQFRSVAGPDDDAERWFHHRGRCGADRLVPGHLCRQQVARWLGRPTISRIVSSISAHVRRMERNENGWKRSRS